MRTTLIAVCFGFPASAIAGCELAPAPEPISPPGTFIGVAEYEVSFIVTDTDNNVAADRMRLVVLGYVVQ